MSELVVLVPYGVLLLGALWALFGNILPGKDRGTTVVGALAAFSAAALFATLSYENTAPFGNQLLISADTRLATVAIGILAGVWLLWLSGRTEGRNREAVALGLFSTMGACLMVQSYDLLVMIVAIELATMPAYVLVGYRRNDLRSLEGAIKYFLLSVLASLIMIFGVTFVIGLSGSTSMADMRFANGSMIELAAILLVLVGVFAKVSAAPFHYWAPDAYEGADTWVVAFVSSIPKIAGFTLAVRLIISMLAASSGEVIIDAVSTIMLIVCIASLAIGAFAALGQKDVRRLMGYSGVVNAGYILMPLAGISPLILQTSFTPLFISVLFAVFYGVASMGILLIVAHEGPKVSDLAGLSKRAPMAAWGLVIFALSMIGVPPLAGFFGKFYIFTASLANGQTLLVVAAVVASAVSAFYYLRLVKAAFIDEPAAEEPALVTDVEMRVSSRENRDLPDSSGALSSAEISSGADYAAMDEKYKHPLLPVFGLMLLMLMTLVLGPLSGKILTWMSTF